MIIKVCGMRQADNIREVARTGIDWMGMIFYDKSPRNVETLPTNAGIIPDNASEAAFAIPGNIKRVGAFVDEMPQTIITKTVLYSLDIIQLHGSETPTLIRNLRATIVPDLRRELKIMKAISVREPSDLGICEQYEDCADLFLFDTKCPSKGGSGEKFDWDVLKAYRGCLPFILSGGIGPDDAERVKAFHHDKLIGIDLNSRFETAPALKDTEAIRRFVNSIRI